MPDRDDRLSPVFLGTIAAAGRTATAKHCRPTGPRTAELTLGRRSALYGTGIGIQGSKLKAQITKQSALDAERLYKAIVDQRARHLQDPSAPIIPASDLVFDPTRPNETDWERILSQHTERLLLRFQKLDAKRSKSAPKPNIA